jgi:hypothetical protein
MRLYNKIKIYIIKLKKIYIVFNNSIFNNCKKIKYNLFNLSL